MKSDAYFRRTVRSRRHAHREPRWIGALNAASFILVLAFVVIVVPLLIGTPKP